MQDCDKTKEQLLEELARARQRIGVLEAAEAERERIRDAVRMSEARFRAITEQCPLGILVADTETRRFVMANAKASAMLGYTEDELLDLRVESIHPPQTLPMTLREFESMISGVTKQSQPLPVLCKDGSLRYVIVNCTLLEIGGQNRILGFFTDITELKRAEESLRESEERYRLLVENAGDAIFLADETGRLLDVNPEAQNQTGFSREELLAFNILDLDMNQTPESLSSFVSAFRSQGKAFFETRHRRKDGSALPVELRAVRLDLTDRMLMLGIARDITSRKKTEAELIRQKKLLRSLIDSTPDAVYVKDAQGRYLLVNQEAARRVGKPVEDILGQSDSAVFPPEQAAAIREYDQLVLAGSATNTIEEQLTTMDGSRAFLTTKGPLFDESGQKVGLFGFSRDITERNRVTETMVQTEKMASVGGLAAGMAHEINNPLGGIMQSAQVLAMRLRPDAPANLAAAGRAGCPMEALQAYFEDRQLPQLLDDVRESAKRAAAIVSNMIEFSEVGSSAWLPIDLNVVAEKSIELCEQDYNLLERYDLKHIAIIREYDTQELNVPCSANQMQQVLFNLLRNAAQALIEAQTPEPAITLRTRKEEKCAVIEVEDNGPGMDEATRKRIFEPFFTTKGPDKGTGLGLSVSYFIVVNRHYGTITVQAAPGGGTRFVIRLPLERIAPAQGLAGGRPDLA
ncbi:PAS domain-containing sensor histidine kinase [Fundidesulfovibrio putealis]|uniref:PAS domain-containing sensor histidine kinase n=1 Tax=Fundidesulfovibrio putealis TaxID=270496 RepID=UPI0004866890|nr:PAS domain S-box protein [Fundidesulfovibrio putealis]